MATEHLIIDGGIPLVGAVPISGSKNAALPIMAAALLTADPVVLTNVPEIRDISIMAEILTAIGCTVENPEHGTWNIHPSAVNDPSVHAHLAERIRGSILLMGALVGRVGMAHIAKPGGDDIGVRRVEQHIEGLRMMGAEVETREHEYVVHATSLHGAWIDLDMPTVTGTENLMMAAASATGVTVIGNAAKEPHVVDLAKFLVGMGIRISGAGTDTIVIEGNSSQRPHGTTHAITSDYIEAGTYLLAGAATHGDVTVTGIHPTELTWLVKKLREMHTTVRVDSNAIRVDARGVDLRGADVTTWPHPGFATDLQAQYVSVMTQAVGVSAVSEAVYEHRFRHVPELRKMGASIVVDGRSAIVTGPTPLVGTDVDVTDIRSGAALAIAALCASGTSTLHNVAHLYRGYAAFEEKMRVLGARMERDGETQIDMTTMKTVIGD